MMRQRSRGGRIFVAILAVGVIVGACGSSAATPTPAPATPTSPPAVVTVAPTPTPAAPATATPTATPAVTAAPLPTSTPEPTPTPVPTPAPGAGCTGSAAARQWLADQATHFTWTLYCAHLPSGWSIDSINGASADYANGGKLQIYYAAWQGKVLWIQEGNFCSTNCASFTTVIGPAMLGDMSGTMYRWESLIVLYVNPGTTHAYTLYAEDVSETDFRNYAAAFIKVPKP
jgi:hypothetical protein